MHGNVGNTEQDMNNMVLSEDILLNANSPNDEYVTDSQMERLHPSEGCCFAMICPIKTD